MKYIILLLFFITFKSPIQTNNCSKFKIGTFKYTDSNLENYTIVRNDSLQIESDSKSGLKMVGKIEWLDNCKYSLTYTEINDSNRSHMIGMQFYINITSIAQNTYKYIAYNDKIKMNGEIIKIKE